MNSILSRITQPIAAACFFLWQGNAVVVGFETAAIHNNSWRRGTASAFAVVARTATTASSSLNLHDDDSNRESKDDFSESYNNRRRSVIGSMLSAPLSSLVLPAAFLASPSPAAAAESKKPFAPPENLLPAVRVKLTIDEATILARSLVAAPRDESGGDGTSLRQQLANLLLKPQNYVRSLELRGVPEKPADLYLKSYQPTKGDLPFQRLLVRSGDVDAWKRLKNKEKAMERSSEIRAALNAYTDALSFSGDSYLLNVDKATRSGMVRGDRLPEIKQVITSDMGMRYLYRNQVLTAMDDVKAELEYQLKQRVDDGIDTKNSNPDDGGDLLDLLVLAGEAMDRWLSLVPSEDVEEALRCVVAEQ